MAETEITKLNDQQLESLIFERLQSKMNMSSDLAASSAKKILRYYRKLNVVPKTTSLLDVSLRGAVRVVEKTNF